MTRPKPQYRPAAQLNRLIERDFRRLERALAPKFNQKSKEQ